MTFQFKYITASGTFDHFHRGHEAFLKKAFELSKKVLIGVTSDKFAKAKQYPHLIESFTTRKERMVAFLVKNNLVNRAELFQLDDVYGSTLKKDTQLEAILVTEKSKNGAELINKKRESLGFTPLTIIVVNLIKTEDGETLSSTHMRRNLVLPESLRATLQKPWGKLFKGDENNLQIALLKAKKYLKTNKPSYIITVGDVVTQSFNKNKIQISLAIVDFRIKREETIRNLKELGFSKTKPNITVENPPGTISLALLNAVEQAGQHESFIIRVIGEEDLAVLPAIIFAKDGSIIVYGQPNEGIVLVEVDEKIKKKTNQLLLKFKSIKL